MKAGNYCCEIYCSICLIFKYNITSILSCAGNGRATSPVGRLVFKTNERLIKRLVGSTPTPSAIFILSFDGTPVEQE